MQDQPISRTRLLREGRIIKFETTYEDWVEGRLTMRSICIKTPSKAGMWLTFTLFTRPSSRAIGATVGSRRCSKVLEA